MTDAPTSPAWVLDETRQRLVSERKLPDFMACVHAVERIAKVAEDQDHHPDLHIESYNRLRIETYTHTEGKVTEKDHALAAAIDAALE